MSEEVKREARIKARRLAAKINPSTLDTGVDFAAFGCDIGFDAGYAAATRWHRIKPRAERIPHKQTLLVTYEKFGAFITAVAWFNEHRGLWFRGDTGEVPFDENILAWCELPVPYTGDGAEERQDEN